MKKSYLVIILALVVMLMSSCQSTPEDEVVKRRSYDKLLETSSQNTIMNYPCEYVDNFVSKDGKVEISFDAKVIVPDVDKIPVIQIDPQPIKKELMQLMVDEFMGGEAGYYPESYLTKSDIEEKLIDYKARLNNDALIKEEYQKNFPDRAIDCNQVKEAIKRRMAKYTKMLENAPEKRESIPSGLNLRPYDFYTTRDHNYRNNELKLTQEQLDERANNQQEHLYLVSDKQMPSGDFIRFITYNEMAYDISNEDDTGIHCVEHYEAQVYRARNDFFKLLGHPFCSTHPINTYAEENFDAAYPDLTISEDDKFYMLTFLPKYRDVPFVIANNSYTSSNEQASAPFFFESIHMKVSNDAIVEFRWSNPTDTSNVINESAKLLGFDEIMKIASNHFKLKYNLPTLAPVWEESETYEEDLAKFIGADIKITEVRLGLGGVPAYNNPGEYMLIPVWNFYGSYAIDSTDDEEDYEHTDTFLPFVTVNAVDGSIVEQTALVDWN